MAAERAVKSSRPNLGGGRVEAVKSALLPATTAAWLWNWQNTVWNDNLIAFVLVALVIVGLDAANFAPVPEIELDKPVVTRYAEAEQPNLCKDTFMKSLIKVHCREKKIDRHATMIHSFHDDDDRWWYKSAAVNHYCDLISPLVLL